MSRFNPPLIKPRSIRVGRWIVYPAVLLFLLSFFTGVWWVVLLGTAALLTWMTLCRVPVWLIPIPLILLNPLALTVTNATIRYAIGNAHLLSLGGRPSMESWSLDRDTRLHYRRGAGGLPIQSMVQQTNNETLRLLTAAFGYSGNRYHGPFPLVSEALAALDEADQQADLEELRRSYPAPEDRQWGARFRFGRALKGFEDQPILESRRTVIDEQCLVIDLTYELYESENYIEREGRLWYIDIASGDPRSGALTSGG